MNHDGAVNGALFNEERVKALQERIPNLSVAKVGKGLHYLQEDCVTPDGRHLDAEWMPWPSIGRMSDLELQAIWRYLRSLPEAALDSV